jgi:hypothetical protein
VPESRWDRPADPEALALPARLDERAAALRVAAAR